MYIRVSVCVSVCLNDIIFFSPYSKIQNIFLFLIFLIINFSLTQFSSINLHLRSDDFQALGWHRYWYPL